MTRAEYEEKVWPVTDEKWDELVKEGLVPDKTPGISSISFENKNKNLYLRELKTQNQFHT